MTRWFVPCYQDSTGDFILDGRGWGFGTVWANDPEADLVAILCTQVLSSTGSPAAEPGFWSATYQALDG